MAVDILIAEDEPSILESLDFILKRAGFTTMRGRSGFEVLKQIRADADQHSLPVLILTAKGQQQDRRIAEELGADVFVTKPYANAEVVGAVRQLLGEDGGPA